MTRRLLGPSPTRRLPLSVSKFFLLMLDFLPRQQQIIRLVVSALFSTLYFFSDSSLVLFRLRVFFPCRQLIFMPLARWGKNRDVCVCFRFSRQDWPCFVPLVVAFPSLKYDFIMAPL